MNFMVNVLVDVDGRYLFLILSKDYSFGNLDGKVQNFA